jgi:hypothetical protein
VRGALAHHQRLAARPNPRTLGEMRLKPLWVPCLGTQRIPRVGICSSTLRASRSLTGIPMELASCDGVQSPRGPTVVRYCIFKTQDF